MRQLLKLLSPVFFVLVFSSLSSAETSQPFKVGTILPLTGSLAEYGVATQNGIKLAQEEHPELFRNIEFIYEDSQYDGAKAIAAFNKLRTIDEVNLMYNWGTEPGRALAPISERAGFPLVTMSHDPTVGEGKHHVIRFVNPGEDFSSVQVQWLKMKKFKKIGIVKTELSYLNNFLAGVSKHLAPDQTLTVIDDFSTSDNDFKTSITKIKSGDFDIIGVLLLSGQISQFYRQAEQLKLSLPTFGTDFFDSTSEVKDANGAMNGAVFANIAISDSFYKRYFDKFKNDFQIAYAGNGYDFAMLAAQLFKSDKMKGEDILNALRNAGSRKGENGEFEFKVGPNNDQYFLFPVVMREIKDRKIITVSSVEGDA